MFVHQILMWQPFLVAGRSIAAKSFPAERTYLAISWCKTKIRAVRPNRIDVFDFGGVICTTLT